MHTTDRRLRIAVVGVGKIGSAFAFQLANTGGHDVTVIPRRGSLRSTQLKRDGAIVDVSGRRAVVQVADELDERALYDLVIVTLLAHQIGPLLPVLHRSAAGFVLFMFNTFEPERLQAALGSARCAFGMPFIQATLSEDGKLNVAIGAGGQQTIIGDQRWVEMFKAAGLPAKLELQMPLWLRCHAPFCVAFESISVAGMRRGGGASWHDALRLARGVHACFAGIKAQGFPIYPKAKSLVDASPPWVMASMLWFMSRIRSFRELLASGEGECRALADVMAAAAPVTLIAKILAMKPS